MERPLTPRVGESALDPRAPCSHLVSRTTTPNRCSDHATSANEPPPSPESIDAIPRVPGSTSAHVENATWPSPEPIKPVAPKPTLPFHVNYIRKLLARQKRDLLHLRAATVGQAQAPCLPIKTMGVSDGVPTVQCRGSGGGEPASARRQGRCRSQGGDAGLGVSD